MDAIRRVIDIAKDTVKGERSRFGIREYCAVVTLDVRNAFNSANWVGINMATPPYLMKILNDYFQRIAEREYGKRPAGFCIWAITVKYYVRWCLAIALRDHNCGLCR